MADRYNNEEGYTNEEGKRLLAEVNQHPRRELIEAISEATFYNEEGEGAGMWWHLSQAYALVEALPALTLDESELCDEKGCGVRGGPAFVVPAEVEIAAAEARGRKQAAHDIAERIEAHANPLPEYRYEVVGKYSGVYHAAADIARAYAAEQDTPR